MRPSFTPAVLIAIADAAALALGLGRPALAEQATARASCGTFVGPAWTWLDMFAGTTKKGNTWTVTARRVPWQGSKFFQWRPATGS